MHTMIAYCGLDCRACPVYLASTEPDLKKQKALRQEVVRLCAEQYGMSLTPEDVTDCDGCRGKRVFSGCQRCEIRKCATGRGLASCADCPAYACDSLQVHFLSDPSAQVRLDALRRQRVSQ